MIHTQIMAELGAERVSCPPVQTPLVMEASSLSLSHLCCPHYKVASTLISSFTPRSNSSQHLRGCTVCQPSPYPPCPLHSRQN